MFTQKAREILFKLLAAGAVCAAIYHAIGLFYPINEAPVWRHALFAVINVVAAVCFIKRPACFLPVFALLTVQQFYSHGTFLIYTWQQKQTIDWPSVLVLVFMPIALYALWEDYQAKKV